MTLPAFPRTVLPNRVGYPEMPTGLLSLAQSGLAQTRTTSQMGRTWEETYIPLKAGSEVTARGFLAALASLYRNQTRFTVAHVSQSALLGEGGGTPVVSGGSQTGFSLVTSGWPASTTVLREGDVLTIAGVPWVRDVGADVTSDGSGNAAIPINPPLIGNASTSAPADGAAITINTTPGAVQYVCFIESLEMPQAGAGPGYYQGCRVKFREATATASTAVLLGLVLIPIGASLVGTLPALANGGAGYATLAVRVRFLDDGILGSTISASGFVQIGTAIEVSVAASGGILTFSGTFNGGFANGVFGTMLQSDLPAPGTGLVFYAVYHGGETEADTSATITLETDDGTVLFTGTRSDTALGAVGSTDGTATGIAIASGSSTANGGLTIDGVEVTTADIPEPHTSPSPDDEGVIGIWGFAGTLAPTDGIGTTLSPAGGDVSYLPGGIWF